MSFCNICGARSTCGSHICPKCGASRFAIVAPQAPSWGATAHAVVSGITWGSGATPAKKVGVAVLLATLFGPLGLLYSSITGSLYLLLGWCFLVLATCDDWINSEVIFPILVIWPICMVWAALAARTYNEDRR